MLATVVLVIREWIGLSAMTFIASMKVAGPLTTPVVSSLSYLSYLHQISSISTQSTWSISTSLLIQPVQARAVAIVGFACPPRKQRSFSVVLVCVRWMTNGILQRQVMSCGRTPFLTSQYIILPDRLTLSHTFSLDYCRLLNRRPHGEEAREGTS